MITPVLLAGGSGTRLWPLSRRGLPKQFAPLLDGRTPFAETAARLSPYAPPVVVTSEATRFMAARGLADAGVEPAAILIEPEGRDTAPAVLAGALRAIADDPEAVVLAAPCDHAIPDAAAFRASVERGLPAAREGRIVTFGVVPDRPETGYGYIEPEAQACGGPVPVRRFTEKPDEDTAREMIASGHLWNAGLFLMRASALLDAVRDHAADLEAPVAAALHGAETDLGFTRLAPGPWRSARAVSVDRAVMERAGTLSVVPFEGRWSDLGGWPAVAREMERDGEGNAVSGDARAIDCRRTLLRSEGRGPTLVGLGLEDVVAVATTDAVLVAHASRAQEVGRAVDALRAEGSPRADEPPVTHRPWGRYETLALGRRFRVKRIEVDPGGILSLQSHYHRAEHWVVVTGTARVTVGEEVRLVTENESIYVPLGASHRLENPGRVTMVLIEVQAGTYLEEDDITRHADAYARR